MSLLETTRTIRLLEIAYHDVATTSGECAGVIRLSSTESVPHRKTPMLWCSPKLYISPFLSCHAESLICERRLADSRLLPIVIMPGMSNWPRQSSSKRRADSQMS